ncbi:MAG: extracellular solute-binding protein [Janthinobacterium lividum]
MQLQDRHAAIAIVDAVLDILRRELIDVGADSWPILSHLATEHFANRSLSITALADHSSLPRTTARRLIFALKAEGLLDFRSATPNSRRMVVEPSHKLMELINAVTERIIKLVLHSVDPKGLDRFDGGRAQGAMEIAWPQTISGGMDGKLELQVLAFDDPVFEIIKQNRLEVERFIGMRLKIATYHQDPYRTQLENALRQPDGDGPTIVAIPAPWLATYTAAHALLDLASRQAASASSASDFYEPVWRMCWHQDTLHGMPIQPSPHLLWYRKDLFHEADLDPPRTFEEVIRCARILHRPDRGLCGITWSAAPGMPLAESFIQILIAQGQQSLEDEVLRVDTPTAKHVVDYLRALLPYSPRQAQNLQWVRSVQNFGNGRAAMCYHFSNRYGMLDGRALWESGGRIGSVEHPTISPGMRPVTPMGGAVLAIPAACRPEFADAAWQAIDILTSPQMTKYFILNGSAGNARYSVAEDAYVHQRNGIIRQTDQLVRADRVQPFPVPATTRYHDMIQTLSTGLAEMIFGPPIDIPARLSKLQKALNARSSGGTSAGKRRR